MGRADQTTKVKGMFVHPSQVAEIIKRHNEIHKARLVVNQRDGSDFMTLACELSNSDITSQTNLTEKILTTIQAVCKLKGEVEYLELGSLPNDGKVIDDIRKYE